MNRFDEINDRLQGYSLKAIFFSSITNPATRFVNSLVYTGVCIVGALSVIGGKITVGTLTCFLSYANQYTNPSTKFRACLRSSRMRLPVRRGSLR